MSLGFGHYQLRRLVDAVVWPIPIDDHSINTSADHVCDLAVNLSRVRRVIADVHMIRPAEPQQQVSVNLGVCSRVEQGMDINFADIFGRRVTVALSDEAIDRARIISGLCGQRRCRCT